MFTAGEQEFYAERGFQNEPQRCKSCRDARKASARGPREYFAATCARCGGEAKVPFEPKSDRPVYCWTAFSICEAVIATFLSCPKISVNCIRINSISSSFQWVWPVSLSRFGFFCCFSLEASTWKGCQADMCHNIIRRPQGIRIFKIYLMLPLGDLMVTRFNLKPGKGTVQGVLFLYCGTSPSCPGICRNYQSIGKFL